MNMNWIEKILLLPLLVAIIALALNSSNENVRNVVNVGANTVVDLATPLWSFLLETPIGVIVFVSICVLAPQLLNW